MTDNETQQKETEKQTEETTEEQTEEKEEKNLPAIKKAEEILQKIEDRGKALEEKEKALDLKIQEFDKAAAEAKMGGFGQVHQPTEEEKEIEGAKNLLKGTGFEKMAFPD